MVADNERDVEQIAREFVDRHGATAVAELLERAELADAIGDGLSARAWRDIAEAADRIIREPRVIASRRE
jgi:hypothetical protein